MQVSLETLSGLERKLIIQVPAEKIDSQVQSKLAEAAKTIQLKGFRRGKVPIKVIKSRYGKGLRQEVLGELMNESYYQALSQEKVRPAGQPRIEPINMKEGENLEFTATFEVYPEIEPGNFSKINVEKSKAEITDKDVDNMIQTLREQRKHYHAVQRAAKKSDQLDVDFVGTIDGEEFEGGSAKGVRIVIGSGSMIPGFEDGLVGCKAAEDKVLNLSFPEDYHKKDLAGKACEFKTHINKVSEEHLPELNEAFFTSFEVKEGGEEGFRAEVKKNMERELRNAVKNNVKQQVLEGLVAETDVELPKSMVENEINNLRHQAIHQYGGQQQIDPSILPAEMFQSQAEQRVSVGLIMNEIIQKNKLKADPTKVREIVEELAEGYENPQEVIAWYYNDKDQMGQVEVMALEDSVIDLILSKASVTEKTISYEDALKPYISKASSKVAKKADSKKTKDEAKPTAKTKSQSESVAEDADGNNNKA
jgi:trigger factor